MSDMNEPGPRAEERKPCRICKYGRKALGLALQMIGSSVFGYGLGQVFIPRPLPPVSTAYVQPGACSACPADIRLASIEVQSYKGSDLFLIRGTCPENPPRRDVRRRERA